jgi:outer membrane protein assembly factor BamB
MMNRTRYVIVASCLLIVPSVMVMGWSGRSTGKPSNGDAAGNSGAWPMFGGTPARNMVNTIDKNVIVKWTTEDGKLLPKHVKWVADLGNKAYGGPVIADGKVFVSTNNARPRDKNIKGNGKAVLMAFNEADGNFLWQIVHEISQDRPAEARAEGLCSTPIVEDKRLFYVTPDCELVCASTAGKIEWTYDMIKELKVCPFHLGNCSPLIVGDLVMLITSNGVNDDWEVVAPKAPSFIAVNKNTGKLAWQSNLPGKAIMEGQWSNPTLAVVNGKPQVIFAGGDCVLYSFEPATGKLIWKCDCNPTRKLGDVDNYIIATPVVAGDRVYVGLGQYPGGHPKPTRSSYFVCVDITKHGDVSPKNYDTKDPVNKNSALVWALGGLIEPRPEGRARQARFETTISTAAVHDGLVYISEEKGFLNCLDAKTGERYWAEDLKASIWGSPYYVDGKIYIGTEDGEVVIFAQGKKASRIATNAMDDGVLSTPIVANGVLYIATRSKLYAIR